MATQQHVRELINKLLQATHSASFEEAIAILLTSAQTRNRTRSLIQNGFLQLVEKVRLDQELEIEEVAVLDKNISVFIEIAESGKLTEEEVDEGDTRGEVPQVVRELQTELTAELQTSEQKDPSFVSNLVDNYIEQSRAQIRTTDVDRQKKIAVDSLTHHTYEGDAVEFLDKTFEYQGSDLEAKSRTIIPPKREQDAIDYFRRHEEIRARQTTVQGILKMTSNDMPKNGRTTFPDIRAYARASEVIAQIPEYRQDLEKLDSFAQDIADAITIYGDSIVYETAPQKLLETVLQLKGVSEQQLRDSPLSHLSDREQKEGLHFLLQADTYTLFSSKDSSPITKVGKVLVGNTFFEVAQKNMKDLGPEIKDNVPGFLSPFVNEIMIAAGNPEKNVAVQYILAASSGEQKEGSILSLIHLTPGFGNDEIRRQEGAAHLLHHLIPKSYQALLQNDFTKHVGMRVTSLGEKFYASLPQPFIAFLVKKSSFLRAINFQFTGRLIPLLTGGRIAISAGSLVASKAAGSVIVTGLTKIGLLTAKITTGPIGWAILGIQIGVGILKYVLGSNNNGEKKGMSPVAIGCLILLIPLLLMIIPLLLIQNTNTQIAVNLGRTSGILEDPNSQYIRITKTASPFSFPDNNAGNVVYTVSVTANGSALTNINITDSFNVLSKGTAPPTPTSALTSPPSVLQDGETYSTTYTVNLSGFMDSLVTNTLTVTADAGSAIGESSTTTATVTIGSPPTGCFELRDDTISYQDGSSTFSTVRWSQQEKNRVLEAIAVLSRAPSYLGVLCRNNEPILVYRSSGSVTYGGFAPQSRGNTIFLYSAGVSSGISTVYTLAHESGHILYYRSNLFDQYLSSGVPSGEGWLPTYPLGKTNFEDFAETFGVFFTVIVYGQDMKALSANQFRTSYTNHYNFARSITGL